MPSVSFTNSTTYPPPAWFLAEADGGSWVIQFAGDAYTLGDTDMTASMEFVSAAISPSPPSGAVVVSAPPVAISPLDVTVSIPVVSNLGDPGFNVDAVRYLRPDRTGLGVAADVASVPPDAPQVVSYETSPLTRPKFDITITVRQHAIAVTDHVYTLQFGAEPNYTPNRDALVAAIEARA